MSAAPGCPPASSSLFAVSLCLPFQAPCLREGHVCWAASALSGHGSLTPHQCRALGLPAPPWAGRQPPWLRRCGLVTPPTCPVSLPLLQLAPLGECSALVSPCLPASQPVCRPAGMHACPPVCLLPSPRLAARLASCQAWLLVVLGAGRLTSAPLCRLGLGRVPTASGTCDHHLR